MPYLRPGAYTERLDSRRAPPVVVRTDVAAFIGIAPQGPLDRPLPVQSFRQFQTWFGGFTGAGYLAYAVRGFFENGGRRCWVTRVASREPGLGALEAHVDLDDGLAPAWRIRALSPGVWGDELSVTLTPEHPAQASIDTAAGTPLYSVIDRPAGFGRGELVCVSQEDAAGVVVEQWRVVSHLDQVAGRLYWRHPEPGGGLPYDRPLQPLDADRPATVQGLRYRLRVHRGGRLILNAGGLSLVPEQADYGPRRLGEPRYPGSQSAPRATASPAPVLIEDLRADRSARPAPLALPGDGPMRLTGGRDGLAALCVDDFIGRPLESPDARRPARGIQALEAVDEIAIVAIPDICIRPEPDPVIRPEPLPKPDPCVHCPPPPEPRRAPAGPRGVGELPPAFSDDQIHQVQAALVSHCEAMGDRFALLDPPHGAAADAETGVAAIQAWRQRFDTSYAALYYPWLKVPEPRGTDTVRALPPCGHIAGLYAYFDNRTGVHRAPANRALAWVQDLTARASHGEHAVLNPAGINLVRAEASRGLRPMGARTLASHPDWRLVNVRRLLLMIRETLALITRWAVFEPNNRDTRNRLRMLMEGYLIALWSRGALVGRTPAEAFFVKCDEDTTAPQARERGRLLALVGVAPSRPLEFVVVRLGLQANALETAEAGELARVA